MNPADVASWAWLLVILAGVNLLVQGAAGALLLRTYLRRHRPLLQLAEVVHEGDLDKAHYLLGQIPGPEGERVRAICGPTVETGPLATARERFLTAFLVAYPGAPAGPKVWTAMLCGAAALLPFFVGAAGRASVTAAAMELGAAIPDQALGLYQLGAIETAAAGAVAWAILLGVHHLDPGARTVRRRLVERQRALRKERPPAPATAAAGRSAHRVP